MRQVIVDILSTFKELKGYKIEEKHVVGYQLFFIKQDLDMNRAIETREFKVTIYKEYKIEGEILQGEASCLLLDNMTSEEIKTKIEEAEFITSLSLCKPYSLIKKQAEKASEKAVSFGGKSLKEASFQIADCVFEADKYDHGYVNSAEVFVYFEENHFLNSLGNEFHYAKSYAQLDLVVTWKDNKDLEEIELHRFYEFDSLKGDYITSVVNNLLIEAKNRSVAVNKMPDEKKVLVMLKDENLKEFFRYFVYKTNVDKIYDRYSNYHIGKQLYSKEATGDKLSITLEGILPGSSHNALCDDDGVALKSLKIIQNGEVKNLWGSSQKAQYLNTIINGKYENIVVEAGTCPSNLSGISYLEIVSLSDMDVDLLTGDFGSEIRFAYFHTKKGTIIPITGGSIVGNMNDSLETLRLSNEICSLNNIKMPKFALLDHVRIFKK